MPRRSAGGGERTGTAASQPAGAALPRVAELEQRLPCWWVLLAGVAVAALGSCLALDDQLLGGPFYLDDGVAIAKNPEILYVGKNLMERRLGSELGSSMNYNDPSRPIVSLTFQLNYAWSGLEPRAFRMCNVVLHWINAVLVFVLADLLVVAARLPLGADGQGSKVASLLASLLFLASPMNHTTAVYVFARSDLMGAMGSLVFTILGLQAFLSRSRWTSARNALPMLVMLSFALFSKQLSVTAPVVLGFLHLVLIASPPRERGRSASFAVALVHSLTVHIPWMAVLAAYFGFRLVYFGSVGDLQKRLPMHMKELPWPWWCYQLSQPYALVRYLLTMIVPLNIAIDHHILEQEWCANSSEISSSLVVFVLVLVLAFSLVVRSQSRGPVESFLLSCLGWFGIHLLPTCIAKTTDVYCERRAYLSSVGVYIALVVIPLTLLSQPGCLNSSAGAKSRPGGKAKQAEGEGSATKTPFVAGIVMLLAWFAVASRQLNPVYYSAESLWREVVRQYPESVRGRNNLGTALISKMKADQGCRTCEAEIRYLFGSLLERDPTDYDAMMNLGDLEREVGNAEASRQWFERVIAIAPDHAAAHFKIATNLHRVRGDYDKIFGHYMKAKELQPTLDDLHNNLALLFVHTGQGTKAREVWAEGLAIHPGDSMLLSNQHVVESAPG